MMLGGPCFFGHSRLQVARDRVKYAKRYRTASVFQAAARLWVEGVPWDNAVELSEVAIQKSEPLSKGQRGKGRGKSGKAKGKGRRWTDRPRSPIDIWPMACQVLR